MTPKRIGEVSFWYADIGLPSRRRPALDRVITADVAIIGAGYTGLWAAYYLRKADPNLSVVVLEKDFAGYGASGRNGGWLTGGFAWNHQTYAKAAGIDATRRMVQALSGTVDEIIAVTEAEGIDADIRRCDEMIVATNPAQITRMTEEIAQRIHWGEDGRIRALDAAQTRARVAIPDALGAMLVSGVARIQPAKLVRGLARIVAQQGVTIHEGSPALTVKPGVVTTPSGAVHAPIILRCTEGFSAALPGHRRTWLPLNSAQIVTEPLPQALWDRIGWFGHEILGDFDHVYCYCQRTREGRIAVGARGLPYRFGSGIDRDGRPDGQTIRRLSAILHRHFPATRQVRIDHAWCGVLGVPRDWCATVGLDPNTGLGWAGGYVGVGVSTANLAGRTLADLTLARGGPLTSLAWVNRTVRQWEPEPLRWLGVHAMNHLYAAADRSERRGNPPSRLATLGNRLTGRS